MIVVCDVTKPRHNREAHYIVVNKVRIVIYEKSPVH